MQEVTSTPEGYIKWAEEYLLSADQAKEKIEKLKKKRKNASVEELNIINHDISIYEDIYYDCSETAKILLNTAKRMTNKKD